MSGADNLVRFRQEVRRWNESINLVSRRGTGERIDALFAQCTDALRDWEIHEGPLGLKPTGRHILYIDIGSGGGFPAATWHEVLAEEAGRLRTVLVEPREKRAWFLERIARELTAPGPEVHACRWGEVPNPATSSPDLLVVSLKALRLADEQILGGLAPFLAPGSKVDLAVARFHPSDQKWSDELVSSLEIPESGAITKEDEWSAEATDSGLVPGKRASLVVSRYRFARR